MRSTPHSRERSETLWQSRDPGSSKHGANALCQEMFGNHSRMCLPRKQRSNCKVFRHLRAQCASNIASIRKRVRHLTYAYAPSLFLARVFLLPTLSGVSLFCVNHPTSPKVRAYTPMPRTKRYSPPSSLDISPMAPVALRPPTSLRMGLRLVTREAIIK